MSETCHRVGRNLPATFIAMSNSLGSLYISTNNSLRLDLSVRTRHYFKITRVLKAFFSSASPSGKVSKDRPPSPRAGQGQPGPVQRGWAGAWRWVFHEAMMPRRLWSAASATARNQSQGGARGREETQSETMKNVEYENVSLGLWLRRRASKRNTSLNLTLDAS